MPRMIRLTLAVLALTVLSAPASAQTFTTDDPVLQSMWEEGMDRSQVYPLAQALLDSIGPRLTGTPGLANAHDWLVDLYRRWGIEAENQQYGTWKGWERGVTHMDLMAPRVRTLDAMLLGWSPGTGGELEADVVALPQSGDDMDAWRESVDGAFVLASPAELSCRPMDQWEEFSDEATLSAYMAARTDSREAFAERVAALGVDQREVGDMLAETGAAGVLTSSWPGGYGVRRIFGDRSGQVPTFSVSCEDFGLLTRLAENGQGPRLRVDAGSEMLGEVPAMNTIGKIAGSERPDEYILLSAHLDSWDGGSGATDNGTGTIVMAEAMRLLRMFYPSPKRTILVGHWGSEEQGLNGSRSFAADNPGVVAGLQAVFNQDNGTGRLSRVNMQGLMNAGAHFSGWLSALPSELTAPLDVDFPGTPGGGGSDYAAFACAGAPAFGLWSDSWDYGRYTWHTNLDTLDKVAFDNVRHNALLIAMLTYMASEDPEFIDRERRTVMPTSRRTGEPMTWPECRMPDRSWEDYGR